MRIYMLSSAKHREYDGEQKVRRLVGRQMLIKFTNHAKPVPCEL